MTEKTKSWLIFGGSMVVVFGLGILVSSLLERRAEVVSVFNNRTFMPEDSIVVENAKFAQDFPREYETWMQTGDTSYVGMYNTSNDTDDLELHPAMVINWAGYAFAWDYNQPRGHRHCNEDLRGILRTGAPGVTPGAEPQPGTCWTCKGTDSPRLISEKGAQNFYNAKWSDWGSEMTNTIGCSDCHDPRTMELRPARPAIYEAWSRRGLNVKDQPRQEMRSLVCAQCHTEYYFSKNENEMNYLYFPEDFGYTVEQEEAYYDSIGFYDYINPLSKAKILKAQHPGYDLFKMGIHGQRGLSCADCHMPYKQEGGIKYTDHHITSPLQNIDRTCQTCHRQDAETLRKNVEERYAKCEEVRARVEDELVKAHLEAKFAWDNGATEAEMEQVLSDIRKSQWRWDFAVAGHGAAFHAPQEVIRILSSSLDYARDARLCIARVVAKHGFTDPIPLPDVSTKAKAQKYLEQTIGIDMTQKRADKEKFLNTVVPQWLQQAKDAGRSVEGAEVI